jgi:hypothetical protein
LHTRIAQEKERGFAAETQSALRKREKTEKEQKLCHTWFVPAVRSERFVTGHDFSRAVTRREDGVLTPEV